MHGHQVKRMSACHQAKRTFLKVLLISFQKFLNLDVGLFFTMKWRVVRGEANMKLCLGRLEILKIRKFRPGRVWGQFHVPWSASEGSLRGRKFSEKTDRKKNKSPDSPEWSHGQQHKPWEPCACFPDYGRGQALTPSNNIAPFRFNTMVTAGWLHCMARER